MGAVCSSSAIHADIEHSNDNISKVVKIEPAKRESDNAVEIARFAKAEFLRPSTLDQPSKNGGDGGLPGQADSSTMVQRKPSRLGPAAASSIDARRPTAPPSLRTIRMVGTSTPETSAELQRAEAAAAAKEAAVPTAGLYSMITVSSLTLQRSQTSQARRASQASQVNQAPETIAEHNPFPLGPDGQALLPL